MCVSGGGLRGGAGGYTKPGTGERETSSREREREMYTFREQGLPGVGAVVEQPLFRILGRELADVPPKRQPLMT